MNNARCAHSRKFYKNECMKGKIHIFQHWSETCYEWMNCKHDWTNDERKNSLEIQKHAKTAFHCNTQNVYNMNNVIQNAFHFKWMKKKSKKRNRVDRITVSIKWYYKYVSWMFRSGLALKMKNNECEPPTTEKKNLNLIRYSTLQCCM